MIRMQLIVHCNFRFVEPEVFVSDMQLYMVSFFQIGWLGSPIFSSKGSYPTVMRTRIASNSIREGRSRSRLPTFSQKWVNTIRGTADFLGLNYYTSRCVEILEGPSGPDPSHARDRGLKESIRPEWKPSASKWLYSVPQGLGDLLRYFRIFGKI